jgi:hypothetical protein
MSKLLFGGSHRVQIMEHGQQPPGGLGLAEESVGPRLKGAPCDLWSATENYYAGAVALVLHVRDQAWKRQSGQIPIKYYNIRASVHHLHQQFLAVRGLTNHIQAYFLLQ